MWSIQKRKVCDMKHLKKAEGYISLNLVIIPIKMLSIVRIF